MNPFLLRYHCLSEKCRLGQTRHPRAIHNRRQTSGTLGKHNALLLIWWLRVSFLRPFVCFVNAQ